MHTLFHATQKNHTSRWDSRYSKNYLIGSVGLYRDPSSGEVKLELIANKRSNYKTLLGMLLENLQDAVCDRTVWKITVSGQENIRLALTICDTPSRLEARTITRLLQQLDEVSRLPVVETSSPGEAPSADCAGPEPTPTSAASTPTVVAAAAPLPITSLPAPVAPKAKTGEDCHHQKTEPVAGNTASTTATGQICSFDPTCFYGTGSGTFQAHMLRKNARESAHPTGGCTLF